MAQFTGAAGDMGAKGGITKCKPILVHSKFLYKNERNKITSILAFADGCRSGGIVSNRRRSWGPLAPSPAPIVHDHYLLNFLNALMPRVTTRIPPMTGTAMGTTAEIAPVISPAIEVRAVVRAEVTPASIWISFLTRSKPTGQRQI